MSIKWLENPNNKKKSRKQEKRLAKRLNKSSSLNRHSTIGQARVQAGSGSLWGAKGDVRSQVNLLECKRTDKKSIILKQEWLNKIRGEAIKDHRIPALGIEIGSKRYVIIEECYL